MLKKERAAALLNLGSSTVRQKMDEWDVEWEFNPPEASHHGGVYERQIRTIRKAIDGLENRNTKNPTDDEFLTCCKMAEYVINCRPLAKSCSEDGLPPLRPIDLMVGALEPSEKSIYPKPFTASDELRRGHRFS